MTYLAGEQPPGRSYGSGYKQNRGNIVGFRGLAAIGYRTAIPDSVDHYFHQLSAIRSKLGEDDRSSALEDRKWAVKSHGFREPYRAPYLS